MFPTISLAVSGLEASAVYTMALDIRSADENRYKYIHSKWLPLGKSDMELPESSPSYVHPESPKTGFSWMKQSISFGKAKITNDHRNKKHVRGKYTSTVES